jgi:anti-sigma factor RsiW
MTSHASAGSPSLADRNCQQQLLELSAYLEGDLTPTKMAELDDHLAHCECCGRMAASLRRAIALCRSDDARELPPDVRARALDRVRTLLATNLS